LLIAACMVGPGHASSCPNSEPTQVRLGDDLSFLQHDRPRLETVQVTQDLVRKASKCAKQYFDELSPLSLPMEYKPWRLRDLPVSRRALVIAAGMGTTGTHGVVTALEDLGLHGYHFKSAAASANERAKEHELPAFISEIVGNLRANASACYEAVEAFDFSQLPSNVDYVGDTPFPELFLDLYTQFPAAKVLLSTRSGLDWAQSRKKHRTSVPPVLRPCGLSTVTEYEDEDLAQMLETYNDLVRCVVPPENLLEINLFDSNKDLIDKLAAFLERDLP